MDSSWLYASGLQPLKNEAIIGPNDVEKDWWDKQCSCKYDNLVATIISYPCFTNYVIGNNT